MLIAPDFYNTADQNIYKQGYSFIPQERFRGGAFNIPTPDSATGITTLPTAMNMGGSRDQGGFNPYNTDMSTIRQDYNVFPSRQAGEIYSKTFNPQPYGTGVESAQAAYNQANQALAQGMDPNSQGYSSFTGGTLTGLKDIANEIIMNNKEQYGAQGQYVNPYDPRYSSMTEAQKFMDNYPDYYYGPPKSGLEKFASKAIDFVPFIGTAKRIAGFFSDKIPINQRAIMENEARGAGIFTDNIGRIVTDDYNTAGGIMAGYNLNQINENTFNKRRGTIENTLGSKYGLTAGQIEAAKNNPNYKGPGANLIDRLGLLDDAEEDILNARKKTQQIYKMKTDKKAADKKRKEAAAAAAAAAKKAEIQRIQSRLDDTGVTGSNYDQAANIAGGGGGNTARNSQGQTAREATYDGNPNTGTSQGYSQHYMDGGRVYYMNGGLANLVDIYDWL